MNLTDFLPTTKKECELLGWDELDVILFSGDAYVDHPSFGVAVIGRVLQAEGLRVAIVPQPDWHGDYRDFRKLGRPRLFFGISPGCMDSMVNKYTANKRLRSEDAYSPDGNPHLRPDYPTIVYTRILKQLYPDVPVVLGGIEASMRRLTHYDYWQDRLLPGILCTSGADLLVYGMGEKPDTALARLLMQQGRPVTVGLFRHLLLRHPLPQTVMLLDESEIPGGIRPDDIVLHSHEECLRNKRAQAENFRHIEEESNKYAAQRILQPLTQPHNSQSPIFNLQSSISNLQSSIFNLQSSISNLQSSITSQPHPPTQYLVVTPPCPPMSRAELDHAFDLPYTRLPHPKYKGKRIPAYDMIKFSVCLHRGCFGGCAFCTISAHQGKFIASRSKESILREVKAITQLPDFKGYISDLGGPSANMYAMHGKDLSLCRQCKRPSCIHPRVCKNLSTDHSALLDIYHAVDALPAVKKSFIGSGVRYDLLLHDTGDARTNEANRRYTRELITRHVSGRLKVAPEHTSDTVLGLMRKPSFSLFYDFKRIFDQTCREARLRQQLIPYFISSHPGCTAQDMAELAVITRRLDFHLEQVQDFTPTPMTVATEMWYTGYDPYTLQPVFSAKTPRDKLAQRQFFFWYKREERQHIIQELRRMGRPDLISQLFNQ